MDILHDAMIRHQVIGTHTPSVLDDTVADLVMGLILATARRISELDRYIRKGLWTQNTNDNDIFGIDVHHSVLGIVGMGRIGEAIAKRAKYGFDMEVQYYNRNKKVDMEQRLGIQYLELDELLKTSDFVVMMTPLTHETKHFFGKREFQLMKNNAIFINASRGQTVDEQALLEALQNHEIVGAGLDVFDQEPIQLNHPFMQLSNIVMVPHIGSATTKTRTEMAWVAAKNIVAALTGQSIPNVIPEHKDLV
jgi:gluconate 2-dehydrogenase